MSMKNLAIIYLYNKGYRIKGSSIINPQGIVLKPRCYSGYPTITVNLSPIINKRKYMPVRVHRIAAYQKYGDKIFEGGIQVRHLDGDSTNFRLSNLSIGTASDNVMDIPKQRRISRAQHASSFLIKYTMEVVKLIKTDRDDGMTYPEMEKKYKMSRSALWYIINKR